LLNHTLKEVRPTMILPLTQPIPIIRDTRRGPPKKRWRNPIVQWVINTLMPVIFITLPATSVLAEDFAYELKATGTHSPDVSFSVKLTATGKETVEEQKTISKHFSDEIESENFISDLFGECNEPRNLEICLPPECDIDYTRGSKKGFDIKDHGSEDIEKESHQLDTDRKCLVSRIQVCDDSGYNDEGKYNKVHKLYGICTYPGQTWTQTQEKGTQKEDSFSISEKEGWIKFAEYDGPKGSSDVRVEYRDNFPPLFSLFSFLDCVEGTDEICLPKGCEIDDSKTENGGPGYGIIGGGNGIVEQNHTFEKKETNWCLKSHVKVCGMMSMYTGQHAIYGKCKEPPTINEAEGWVSSKKGVKDTVLREYRDNLPSLISFSPLSDDCEEGTSEICLPEGCNIDDSKSTENGEHGYRIISDENGFVEQNHKLDEKTKCLKSHVKVCGMMSMYTGQHVIYGKCKVPSPTIEYYEDPIIVSKTPADASIQVGMFKSDPREYDKEKANSDLNGNEFWAHTTYRQNWSSTPKTGTASIPTHDDGIVPIDSVSGIELAPNKDTTYSVSIIKSGDSYTQNKQGIVDAVNFMGWLSGTEHKFWVTADMSLRPPGAIIESITPNPAGMGKEVSFFGKGTYGTNPNPPITKAVWETNRSDNPLYTCSTSPCNFVSNNLDAGQHLIGFSVTAKEILESPEVNDVLKINVPPLASITSVESTGKKDGIIKAVKWDDSTGHDPIHFVGQATDLDGNIAKYEWKSDRDGVFGNEASFSYSKLSLGIHTISFRAQDDNGEWSNTAKTQIEVMKPPVLLVHGWLGSPETTWEIWPEKGQVWNDYPIHKVDIVPNNDRVSYGAGKVSEKIEELTTLYGIPKVNIVAHSMGGLNSRWYIQNHGYRNDVNKLVMLGTPNHGATAAAFMDGSNSKEANKIKNGADSLGGLSGMAGGAGTGAVIGAAIGGPVGAGIGAGIGAVVGWHSGIITIQEFISHKKSEYEPGGAAVIDLTPQSSALRALNGNVKDEGCHKDNSCGEHEPDDNINTVYGKKVPYFTIHGNGGFDCPGITHTHRAGFVIPFLSVNMDRVVDKMSLQLDGVDVYEAKNVCHSFDSEKKDIPYLTGDEGTRNKVIEYLGFPSSSSTNTKHGTRKAQRQTREKVNKADALAGHVLYAPENGQLATISAGETLEQSFEVDATINNLHVVLMGVATEDSSKPSLYLVSPSGEVIDENTSLSNVDYDNDNPNGVTYHITEVEPGTWTAVITSTHSEPMQYALLATGETNFWLGIAEGTQIEPGDPLTLSAYAQKDGSPMAGLDVNAVLVKTLDEGERIGKYGSELRDAEPVTVALTDIGNGHYELVYDDTTAPGAYRVFMTATDPETEASRVAFTTFFVEYDYELAIQSDDIQFSNEHPEHNETITISATIHNDSGLEANGVEVWFADGHLNEGGTVFAKETLVTIAAGSSATITAPWLATAGPHDIVVIVSPMNTFIETNLDNNTASKTIMVADNPPVADAGLDQKARFDTDTQANVHIFLDGSGSTDERPIERYEWDIDTRVDSNNDGITDNDVDLTGVRPLIPAGTYISVDTYDIKLTVFDALNQSHSDTLTVQLTEAYDFEPPVAEAGPNQSVAPGTPIYFDGSGSRDNYGMATYIWDIDTAIDSNGDGLPDNDVDLIGKRPVLTWGYPEAGIYTVKLTIADVAGNDPGIDTLIVDTTGQQVVAPTGPYRVFGTLEDQLGNSIAGATIQVADQTTITDATGAWEIKGLHEAEYTLNASKEGYIFAEKHFILSDNIHKRKVDIEANSILQIEMMPFTRGGGNNGPSYLKALYAEQALPQGENLIYLITVTNEGHDIAKEIMLTNTLPENGELVSIEALTGGSCDASTMTCTLPDLANGAFANVQVEISNTQTEPLVNTASVMMNALTSDVQVITTEIKPYLSVTISDTPDPIEMLSPLNYTVDIELNQYAPSLASGIDLAMTLPLGVGLKSVMSNDASCNTNQFPEITCTLSDLNVNSQTTIGIDVLLEDAGLLALTHQAEVKANEYPTHTVIERTEIMIPDDIEVDIALVIDVTGSMREEINGIIDALKQFIAENDPNSAPLSALITFRDNVHVKAFTRDLNVLLSAVSELQVWGGGICQEAAVEALNIAIPHVKNGGKILFATDASPYHDADIDGVTEQLLSKGIRFNALLTGDCSDKSSWNELP
jgi:uncharacterized repeat protein (TIGR01451 family)